MRARGSPSSWLTDPAVAAPRPSAARGGRRSWPPPWPHRPSTWGDPLVFAAAGHRARAQPQHGGQSWAEHDVKPWQTETFKFSTDPELEARVRDVVGLYLDPPAHAIVLCVDEKSQIQALERTQPPRPVRPGQPERRTHDYRRHGTTTLFAALEVATGQVTDACHPRHRHGEFLGFLKLIARAYPRRQLHVVLDNCGHPQARQGPDLADQPSPNPPALHTDLCVLADL